MYSESEPLVVLCGSYSQYSCFAETQKRLVKLDDLY